MAVRYNYPISSQDNICYFDLSKKNRLPLQGSNIINFNPQFNTPLETFDAAFINNDNTLTSNATNIFSISGSRSGTNLQNFNFINKTYSFWIYPLDVNSLQIVMSYGLSLYFSTATGNAVSSSSAGLVFISAGKIHASYHGNLSLSPANYSYSTKTIEPNTWQNITITCREQRSANNYDGFSPIIHVNGASADALSGSQNYSLNINYANAPFAPTFAPASESVNVPRLHLGNNRTFMRILTNDTMVPPMTNGFQGLFGSQFYYYNRVMTLNQVKELYNKDRRQYGIN
jgi:hypothetical protein